MRVWTVRTEIDQAGIWLSVGPKGVREKKKLKKKKGRQGRNYFLVTDSHSRPSQARRE